jgi:DNA-binding beta-propeller fold protein YncE
VLDNNDNKVIPINLSTKTPGTPIDMGANDIGERGNVPGSIAITPDGSLAFVVYYAGTVSPIYLPSGQSASTPIDVGLSLVPGAVAANLVAIAITPGGKTAYVVNAADSTITPIDVATTIPSDPIKVGTGTGLRAIAITPDGKTAYVADVGGGGTVTPIGLAGNVVGAPITVGASPSSIAIAPYGKMAYVTTSTGVTPINLTTNTPEKPISVNTQFAQHNPLAIAITPDGTRAYVVCGDGTVTPIELSTQSLDSLIVLPGQPGQGNPIAIAPNGTAYVVAGAAITPLNGTPIQVYGATGAIAFRP